MKREKTVIFLFSFSQLTTICTLIYTQDFIEVSCKLGFKNGILFSYGLNFEVQLIFLYHLQN